MVQISCRFVFVGDNPAGNTCLRHRHPCTEVVLMLSGDGVLHQDGQRYPYHTGTAIIYQPGPEHWIAQHRAGRHLCLGIVGAGADLLPPGVWRIPASLEPVLGMLVREIASRPNPMRMDLLAGLVVSHFTEGFGNQDLDASASQPSGHLAQAEAILQAHLDRPLGVGELADALFISPGYLRQLFRQSYGHGPMHHLLELRVTHAKKLLTDTTLPVGEVADRCGFASPFHFSRVFSRLAGKPPSVWRTGQKPIGSTTSDA